MPAEGSQNEPKSPLLPETQEGLLLTTAIRSIIFANGELNHPESVRLALQPGDVLIAADGGARLCRQLGLAPSILIGDFDSLDEDDLAYYQSAGTEIIRHPRRKDFTDLELALRHAHSLGVKEALVFAALGKRWDQTLANLLLPATADLAGMTIRLADGFQEIMLLRGPGQLILQGQPGDTVSLIPLGGDAYGVSTDQLEYPLFGETLFFGATRGLSNVLLAEIAEVRLRLGLLLCVVIHVVDEGRRAIEV
jgi:thiamine pyrophosphokinase